MVASPTKSIENSQRQTKNVMCLEEDVVNGTAILRIDRQEYDQAIRDGFIPVFDKTNTIHPASAIADKPVVGITGRFAGESKCIYIRREVVAAIADDFYPLIIYAGMDPTLIEICQQLIAGLIIPGGQNLNEYWFDESEIVPDLHSEAFAQDVLELQMVAWALNNGVPVLGICRGMQVIAALAGFKVANVSQVQVHHSDEVQQYPNLKQMESWHQIILDPQFLRLIAELPSDDPFAMWLASLNDLTVNSMHHQGTTGELNPNWHKIQKVAPVDTTFNSEIVARSIDEVAEVMLLHREALEKILALAFQGHPEVSLSPHELRNFYNAAFGSFVQMVMKYVEQKSRTN